MDDCDRATVRENLALNNFAMEQAVCLFRGSNPTRDCAPEEYGDTHDSGDKGQHRFQVLQPSSERI